MSDAVKPDPSDAKLVLEYEFDAPPAKGLARRDHSGLARALVAGLRSCGRRA